MTPAELESMLAADLVGRDDAAGPVRRPDGPLPRGRGRAVPGSLPAHPGGGSRDARARASLRWAGGWWTSTTPASSGVPGGSARGAARPRPVGGVGPEPAARPCRGAFHALVSRRRAEAGAVAGGLGDGGRLLSRAVRHDRGARGVVPRRRAGTRGREHGGRDCGRGRSGGPTGSSSRSRRGWPSSSAEVPVGRCSTYPPLPAWRGGWG